MVLMASISFGSATLDIYVVHMDKVKMEALDGSSNKRWYESVMDSISIPKLLYIYETAISGFSAKLNEIQLEKLKKVDGFVSAIQDEMLSLHTTHSPQFLGLRNGRGLWNGRSLGSDIIIGIVDTGIWPEHISFHDYPHISHVPSTWKGICEAGTKFSAAHCNKKLIGARAFFKGYEAIVGSINETVDYRSPRDSEGHGTHTASTAAGNLVKGADFLSLAKGSARGIRYTSRIAVYKACYSLGCANSDVLAAIDQAVSDGVDVLSLSLGGVSRPYYTDNIAIASFRAIANGIFVSSSAGNSGPRDSSVGNTAPWLMTVAASYTDRIFPNSLKLGDGRVFKGTSLHSGKLITKQIPLVYGAAAAGDQGAEFCIDGTLSPKLVKGKIVVCDKGINNRVEKGEQVKLAGGAGMVLVNTETEGEELIADAHVLPAILVGARAANSIKMYINSTKTNATASIKFEGTVYNDPAPVMAAFSSRGPNSAGPDIIKPDVTAPGVNILAAWPPNISPTGLKTDKKSVKFNIVSGTSMSCPHVTGIAALLKSIHKDWSPAAIKSAIMTTAYVLDNTNNPIQDAAFSGNSNSGSATPFAFGSGHVDPESAADPGLVYDISDNDYLNYLCSLNYTSSQLAIFSSNKGFSCPDDEVLQPGDLNYPSFAVMFSSTNNSMENATVVTYKRTLTNVGTLNSTYAVTVIEPSGVSVTVDPKVLNFKTIGEKLSYEVSFSAPLMAERSKSDDTFSFGSITWESKKYTVRSPIAITWQQ